MEEWHKSESTEKEIKLDKKDKEILYQLDLNARQSNEEIAKKLRLNKNVVSYRINRLESLGVIQGYETIIDFSKLGFFLFRVYIDFYEFDIEKEKKMLDYLAKEKNISNLIKTIGDWNIILNIYVKKLEEFDEIFYKILNNFREIIKNYDIEIVIKDKIIPRRYLIKEMGILTDFLEIGGNPPDKIDNISNEIISLLTKNAKMPIIEIASKLKLTSMAVIHRINQLMKKKIIIGYKAKLDLDKIGYTRYKLFFELENTNIIKNMISYCEIKNFVVMITKAIGNNFDFRIDLEINKPWQIYNIINDIKNKFPRKIRDYKYVKFIES
ncbi:MAG: winged helix-turn-helix transcriptional regulator [Candidatus Pacearchaeota archaeon]